MMWFIMILLLGCVCVLDYEQFFFNDTRRIVENTKHQACSEYSYCTEETCGEVNWVVYVRVLLQASELASPGCLPFYTKKYTIAAAVHVGVRVWWRHCWPLDLRVVCMAVPTILSTKSLPHYYLHTYQSALATSFIVLCVA